MLFLSLLELETFDGFEYIFPETVATWQQSRNVCQAWGGDLASVPTGDANDFLTTYVSSDHNCPDAK